MTVRITRGTAVVLILVLAAVLVLLMMNMGTTNSQYRFLNFMRAKDSPVPPLPDLADIPKTVPSLPKTDSVVQLAPGYGPVEQPANAPLLKSVEEQRRASKTLQKLLHRGSIQYGCQNMVLLKNRLEGTRKYCMDQAFRIQPPSCLIYSFGVNYDFTFEDTFGDMGCEVFSFDPSMTTQTHRRSRQVMFYQMGLGGQDTDTFQPRLDQFVKEKTYWKMRTLKSLIAMLNHTQRTIDMVKMDIECYEWDVVRNSLQSGAFRQVKQFLVEWHIFPDCPTKERFQQLLNVLSQLERSGFKVFVILPNGGDGNWERFRVQTEIGYVNTNFVNNGK